MFRLDCYLASLILAAPVLASQVTEPQAVLLTWQRDPTTTMTIDWHVDRDHREPPSAATLAYQHEGENEWQSAHATLVAIPQVDRTVYRVELVGLDAGTTYRFRTGDFSRIFSFRTMPADLEETSLVFAVGGDTGYGAAMQQLNRVVMTYDPDFIVWGGDLAGDDGLPERWNRWKAWFSTNHSTLITEAGRVVPIVVGIGNHEVHRRRGGNHYYGFPEFSSPEEFSQFTGDIQQWRRETAPYFYSLFAFPGQPGYGVLDFGTYLSLIVLDSDHTNPVEGLQASWLEEVLNSRAHVSYRIPIYHVPAYPSIRDPESRTSANIRRTWSPLFEQHGVRLAFEHHDHAYKRSVPIRNQKEHSEGVVYFGDGPWGAELRQPHYTDPRWYLSHTASSRYAIIVTLQRSHQHVQVVNTQGQLFDEYPVGRIGLDGGLRHPEGLFSHLAALLREPRMEHRSAARDVLAAFVETLHPEKPEDRHAFQERLQSIYMAIDEHSASTRRLAYQVLLMHADFLHDHGDAQRLLRTGLDDPISDIRELAQEISELDPKDDGLRLRDTLQALRYETVMARREARFERNIARSTPQHPNGAEAIASEPAGVYRLPAQGWRISWDESRLGHEQKWYAPEFDDHEWERVEIERLWNSPVPDEPYIGVAWYRTTVDLPVLKADGALRLHFGGVDETVWVWVNGHYVGQHNIGPSGYNQPFQLDVTGIMVPGERHQITLRVSNTRGAGGVWQPIDIYGYDRTVGR